mgnify:CR=1 FL=1
MNRKLYPGMTADRSLEIFAYEGELKVMKEGQVKNFTDLSFQDIASITEAIDADINVKLALHDMHPDSQMRRIAQFAFCRLSGLDFQPDIIDGKLQDGEYVDCPNRGSCPHEGTLCKLPVINNERLTITDVLLMQHSSSELTNDVIAEKMGMAMGTLHQAKKILYKKIGVQTKQRCAVVANYLGLI